MRMVTENLTRAAIAGVAAVLALTVGEGRAAPFRIVSDGPESVWVLDAASGKLTWCRLKAAIGPKVLDVFGESVETRPQTPHRSLPDCSEVLAAAETDPRTLRARTMFAHGVDRIGGYGDGYRYAGGGAYGDPALTYSFGDYSLEAGAGQINIVRPRHVDITVN